MRVKLSVVLVLVTVLSLGLTAGVGADDGKTDTDEENISPFWGTAISQWNYWIVRWAKERELDPDLVAAVIRKESVGRANARGPYGAVGLMMVLPAEISGMPWRPSAEELTEPGLNIQWGTGILKEIISETGGDLPVSLAAYNGGWNQLHLAVTQRYAHSVLTYYAYAIAARHGYSYQEGKVWTMVLMSRVDGHIEKIWTDTSGHFLAPCFDGALEFRDLFPEMVDAPRTRVTRFTDKDGREVVLDAWLIVGGRDRRVSEMMAGTFLPTSPRVGHQTNKWSPNLQD